MHTVCMGPEILVSLHFSQSCDMLLSLIIEEICLGAWRKGLLRNNLSCCRTGPVGGSKAPHQPHHCSWCLSCDLGVHAQEPFLPDLVVGQSEGQVTFPMKSDNFSLPRADLTMGRGVQVGCHKRDLGERNGVLTASTSCPIRAMSSEIKLPSKRRNLHGLVGGD